MEARSHSRIARWRFAGLTLFLFAGAMPLVWADSVEALIETDGSTFRVVDTQVKRGTSRKQYRQALRDGFLYIESLDAAGRMVQTQSIPDPTQVVYDFKEQAGTDEPLKGGRIRRPTAQFRVQLPAGTAIRALRISRQQHARGARKADNAAETADTHIRTQASGEPLPTAEPLPTDVRLQYLTTVVLEGGS